MKFFGWMQNKLNVKQVNRPSISTSSHNVNVAREEFSDWPHGLLAIGTFGNNGQKENAEIEEIQDEPSEAQEEVLEDSFTQEELGKLQKELTKLLSKSKKRKSDVHKELANLPLDRFLNCPSSLEVDRRISNAICNADSDGNGEDIERTISVLLGRCKEISSFEKKRCKMGKKSVSFLLKKMFVCADGFAPTPPSLRDTLQESRMEKLLRMMLHKKINQQSSSSRGSAMKKKYLEDMQTQNQNAIDENNEEEKVSEGKWVKTDSDFIVLEI